MKCTDLKREVSLQLHCLAFFHYSSEAPFTGFCESLCQNKKGFEFGCQNPFSSCIEKYGGMYNNHLEEE